MVLQFDGGEHFLMSINYSPFGPTGVQLFLLIVITAFALCTCVPGPTALKLFRRH